MKTKMNMFNMMEMFLGGTAIDTTLSAMFGQATLSQTSTEKTENGWKTKTVEAITADGKLHTYVTELKLDGSERKYHEKTVLVSIEDLEAMEGKAVAAKDYQKAQLIKDIIDIRKAKTKKETV